MERAHYPKKWQKRFDFFDKNGAPNTPQYKSAFKAETFRNRLLYGMNYTAFFFGFIYFFVLGLWKKNLSLLGVVFCVSFIIGLLEVIFDFDLSRGAQTGLGIGLAMQWGLIANYAYYLKEEKGLNGWNPFEGMRLL